MGERAGNSGTGARNSSLELYVSTVTVHRGIRYNQWELSHKSRDPSICVISAIRVLIDYVKGTRMTWILQMHTDLHSSASPALSSICFIAITDAPVNVACAFSSTKNALRLSQQHRCLFDEPVQTNREY
jgi:hypothetical protein